MKRKQKLLIAFIAIPLIIVVSLLGSTLVAETKEETKEDEKIKELEEQISELDKELAAMEKPQNSTEISPAAPP